MYKFQLQNTEKRKTLLVTQGELQFTKDVTSGGRSRIGRREKWPQKVGRREKRKCWEQGELEGSGWGKRLWNI